MRRGAAPLLAELAGELLADALLVALASSPGSDQQPVPPLRRSHSPRVYRPMVAFMAANRLPAIDSGREFVEAGGLIGYSANYDDLLRQAAGYVDRILKGEPPGELPVQQAATFELRINLTAAKALGLTVSPSILPAPTRSSNEASPTPGRCVRRTNFPNRTQSPRRARNFPHPRRSSTVFPYRHANGGLGPFSLNRRTNYWSEDF